NAFEEARRRRWTTRDGNIDRDDVRDTPAARIALAEYAARAAAVSDRDDELRVRRRTIRALQGDFHMARNRPGDEQQVRMTRARDEADTEAFDVVERIVERVDFQLASVA